MNLYLTLEILNREFHSKLLIAMESASRGMNVYLGRLKPYLMRDFFAPGIILDKSITPTPNRLNEMKYCKKKNFFYTSLDEEVGLLNINQNYLKHRYSNESLNLVDKVFCWGRWDYNNLSKKYPKHKKKFILSGNPRIDFWRKDFDFFYKNKKLEHENYIFFSLNFTLLSKLQKNKYVKFLKKGKYVERGISIKIFKKGIQHSFMMFKKFSKLMTTLANKTDYKIIVRPHPLDPISNYKFLKKYKNVSVIKKGSISEWIYGAKIVVHSNCTGGFEASVRGYPTISYCPPVRSDHGYILADQFSKKTNNLNECIRLIHKLSRKGLKLKKDNRKNIKHRAHNILSKKTAFEMIVDEFIKIQKIIKFEKKNNNLALKFKFKIRDLRTKILNYKYGGIKFSTFEKEDTLKIFEILKKLNPKYNDLSIDFIKKDIILIKNND